MTSNLDSAAVTKLYRHIMMQGEIGLIILNEVIEILHLNASAAELLQLEDTETSLKRKTLYPAAEIPIYHFYDSVPWLCINKVAKLIERLESGEYIEDWEVNINATHVSIPLMFSGMKRDGYYVLAVKRLPNDIQKLIDTMMAINAELNKTHRQLYRKQQQLTDAKKSLDYDLKLAKRLQKALVSSISTKSGPISLKSIYEPASTVGGDLYDMVSLDSDRVGVFICDVSGHGVASALVMTMIKNYFRNKARDFQDPASFFEALNAEFMRLYEMDDVDLYATAFYMIINKKTHTGTYSGAGHPYPKFMRSGQETIELALQAPPIGAFVGTSYSYKKVELAGGDKILLFTDGLEELISLEATHYETVDQCFSQVESLLQNNKRGQVDDICMLLICYDSE